MDDIRGLIGEPAISSTSLEPSSGGESMTGGVGTTFYRAPEQEGKSSNAFKKGDSSSYTVQADVFSFGIILFEMFHPPFPTYMERAETLTILRGDRQADKTSSLAKSGKLEKDYKEGGRDRFPKAFVESAPENVQR